MKAFPAPRCDCQASTSKLRHLQRQAPWWVAIPGTRSLGCHELPPWSHICQCSGWPGRALEEAFINLGLRNTIINSPLILKNIDMHAAWEHACHNRVQRHSADGAR